MKKSKSAKIPNSFGKGVTDSLFVAADGRDLFSFVIDFCKEAAKVRHSLLEETLFHFRNNTLKKIKDPELKKDVEHIWNDVADGYSTVLLTIGFAMGQRIDLNDPRAEREIDYVWQRAKEEGLFPIYPRVKSVSSRKGGRA